MDTEKFLIDRCDLSHAPTLSLIGSATFLASFIETIDGDALVKHCHKEHSVAYYEKILKSPDWRSRCWILRYKPTAAPIGYLMTSDIQLPVEHSDADIEIKRIYLLPNYVGHGLGKALMQVATTYAETHNAHRLLLGTYEENMTAVRFYQREGFTVIGKRPFNVGGVVYDDIVMGKDL